MIGARSSGSPAVMPTDLSGASASADGQPQPGAGTSFGNDHAREKRKEVSSQAPEPAAAPMARDDEMVAARAREGRGASAARAAPAAPAAPPPMAETPSPAPFPMEQAANKPGASSPAPAPAKTAHPVTTSSSDPYGNLGAVGAAGPMPFPGDMATSARAGVNVGMPDVQGDLPAEVVKRIIQRELGRLRGCYEDALRRSPGLSGGLRLAFTINERGNVVSPYIASDAMSDAEVRACVVRAALGMSFPLPSRGSVLVNCPITFFDRGGGSQPLVARARPIPTGPTATHMAGNDAWLTQGDADSRGSGRRSVNLPKAESASKSSFGSSLARAF